MTDPDLLPPVDPPPEDPPAGDGDPLADPPDDPPADDGDPKGFTKAINRKHWEMEEERRRADALQERIDALEAAQQTARPEVPDMPDPYDENFEELLATRDQAIHVQAAHDALEAAQQTAQQQQAQQAQQAQQQAYHKAVTTYSDRAKSLGLSPQELEVAGMAVAAGGISAELTDHILADEKGPLITAYLAKNPPELETLRGMTTIQAGIYVATHVTPKATAAAGTSNAPPPPDSLSGGGAPPSQRGPKGTTYE